MKLKRLENKKWKWKKISRILEKRESRWSLQRGLLLDCTVKVRAVKMIEKGDEVTQSYLTGKLCTRLSCCNVKFWFLKYILHKNIASPPGRRGRQCSRASGASPATAGSAACPWRRMRQTTQLLRPSKICSQRFWRECLSKIPCKIFTDCLPLATRYITNIIIS